MHRLHRLARLALVIGAMVAGCSGPEPSSDRDASAAGTLHLGEGESEFRAIAEGDTLLLARGCQGSQHVWITLRSEGMDPRGMLVDLDLVRLRDEVSMTGAFRLRLSFTEDASGEFAQLTGLTLQVPDAEQAIGEELELRGWIEDRDGVRASAERQVRVEWGSQVCATR